MSAIDWNCNTALDHSLEFLIKATGKAEKDWASGSISLMFARERKHRSKECVNLLIRAGADINKHGKTGSTALIAAAENGHEECVNFLIRVGADVNKKGKYGATGLILAAKNGHDGCVNTLIKAGANVNTGIGYGSSALTVAARYDHVKCVNLLIKGGASVNASDENDFTALHCATKYKHPNCVRKLVHAGADVNAKSKKGKIALFFAIQNDNFPCVNSLLDAGADVNTVTTNPKISTPLLEAVCNGSKFLVRRLLQANAKINIVDSNGYNVLSHHIARGLYSREICWLLYVAGEKPMCGVYVPEYLKRADSSRLDLNHICRQAIRKHLLNADPYSHLFGRIPRLGLPSIVTEYLLYELSLDDDEVDLT